MREINEITFSVVKALAGKRLQPALVGGMRKMGSTQAGRTARKYGKKVWRNPVGNFAARGAVDAYVGSKIYKSIKGRQADHQNENPVNEDHGCVDSQQKHNCDEVHPGMTCSQWKKMESRKKTPAINNKQFGTPGMS